MCVVSCFGLLWDGQWECAIWMFRVNVKCVCVQCVTVAWAYGCLAESGGAADGRR